MAPTAAPRPRSRGAAGAGAGSAGRLGGAGGPPPLGGAAVRGRGLVAARRQLRQRPPTVLELARTVSAHSRAASLSRSSRARGLARLAVLLAEQEVGDLGDLVGGQLGVRRERGEAGVGARPHGVLGDLEELRDLLVGAPSLEDELDHGALVRCEGVERHRGHVRVVCRSCLRRSSPCRSTGFDALYGLEILSLGDEEATARVAVRDEILQPAGLVHGGVYASIAESLTSFATWKAVSGDGSARRASPTRRASCARSRGGTIHATARRRHRGRTTWVWEVDITDDEGRVCALVRMTVAVREAPARVTASKGPNEGGTHGQQTKADAAGRGPEGRRDAPAERGADERQRGRRPPARPSRRRDRREGRRARPPSRPASPSPAAKARKAASKS